MAVRGKKEPSSMSYNLQSFCSDITSHNYGILSLDLTKNGQLVAALQNQLNGSNAMNDKSLDEFIESQGFHGGKWTRFDIMIASFLKYCRDVNPWSSWDSCDVVFQYYSDLNNCLLNDSYPCDDLVPVFIEATEFIIPLSRKLDDNYMTLKVKKYQFLSHISSIISKLFNSIKSNKDNFHGGFRDLPGKQKILLYTVNKLNNIYFRIESPQLCSNIFKNFKPKSSIDNFSEYPVNEQIEYRYLLGRYYLLNSRITNAFVQLNNAFSLLLSLTTFIDINSVPELTRNINKVLRFLIPVGLMMDKKPKFEIVASFNPELAVKYKQLVQCIRSGNLQAVNNWLRIHQSELLERCILLTLVEKLPMITYKYLVQRLIQDYSLSQNLNRLPYEVLARCLKISIGENDYHNVDDQTTKINIYNGIHSSDNAENILLTLINLGYLRGNCFPSMRLCVFKKSHNISDILPPIEERIINSFPLNNDDSWLEN